MASGTADLQRDLGGALMTSIFGALLTAGYASSMGVAISSSGQDVSATTQSALQLSYSSAADLANNPQYAQYASQITAAAKSSFLQGDNWAYIAAMIAIAIGMSLVFFFFPSKDEELALRATYLAEDSGVAEGEPAERRPTDSTEGA
jgi:DHA2 family multidrug resistance protein-like MFS transporter